MSKTSKAKRARAVRGPGRTTRDDWLLTALRMLIDEGVESVKIAVIAARLECARSSFYWYFRDREELLGALLDLWQGKNTRAIVAHADEPAPTINLALINVYACLINSELFDTRLDFAVRDWARRDAAVRRAVNASDDARLDALAAMFLRHGYAPDEAAIRARIVYFTQIGYEALDTRENRRDRTKTGPHYIYCHTGRALTPAEAETIRDLAMRLPAR